MSKGHTKKSIRRLLYRWLLFSVTFAAVIFFIIRNFRQISSYNYEFSWALLMLSLFFVMSAYVVRFFIWTRLTSSIGLTTPMIKAGRAYFLSLLGRYVPGKVGLALVRIEAYTGYSKIKVVMATGMELIAAIAAALVLALIGLAFSPVSFPSYLRWTALIMVIPIFVVLYPPILKSLTNWFLRLVKKEELDRFPRFRDNLTLVGLYTLPGFLHGLGLFSVLNSLYTLSFKHYLTITGSYYAASLAGLVALFAPGGLGVREAILFLVLPFLVPKEIAIASAVVIRLVTIVGEIILAGGAIILARNKNWKITIKKQNNL